MRSKVLLAALSVLLTLTVAAQAQDGVTLRYNFMPDESRSYDLNVTGGGQILVSGTPMGDINIPLDLTINGSFEMITRVVDPNGDGHVGVNLGAMAMEVTVMGQAMHMVMDLEKGKFLMNGKEMPTPPGIGTGLPPGAAFSKLTFVLSPRGGLVDVEGLDEFMAAMKQAGPMGAMSPTMMPNLKEILKGCAPAFPEGPVAPGQGWEQSFRFPLPGQAEPAPLTIKYVLEKVGEIRGHRIARIGYSGDWELKDLPMQPRAEGQPSPGKIDRMAMQTEGQMYIDVTAGFLHSARLTLTMDLDMTTVAPPQPPTAEGAAGAGGTPPAEGEQAPAKVAIKGIKLYYNLYPRGGISAAAEM